MVKSHHQVSASRLLRLVDRSLRQDFREASMDSRSRWAVVCMAEVPGAAKEEQGNRKNQGNLVPLEKETGENSDIFSSELGTSLPDLINRN